MANGVLVDTKTVKDLVSSIRELKEEISSLKKAITNPCYGCEAWWKSEIEKGETDIKAGNYKMYKNAKSLISDLHK